MAFASFTDAFSLLANEETFVDKDLLYVAGGCLVLLALVMSFAGMRMKDFPSPTQLRILIVLTASVVVLTGFGALQTSRFEQAERRAENQEAAKESQAEDIQNQESQAGDTAGEAADPNTDSGATPGSSSDGAPQSSTGGAGGASADVAAGRTLFVDTGCGSCHTLADAKTDGQIGPVLDDVIPGMSAEEVRTSIVDPGAKVEEGFPDGTMPTNYGDQLDETQLDTLVAYLTTVTK